MKKRWIPFLCVLMLLCSAAFAEFDDEEVSLPIYDAADETESPDATPGADAAGAETPVTDDAGPTPTPNPAEPVYEKDRSILLTLSFTGDVTIGDNVQVSGTSAFEKELKKQHGDINFCFRNVRELFQNDDLTMVNFEGTLTTASRNKNKLDNEFLFRASPEYVSLLKDNGVETVSLENNHVLDMGTDGLNETKQTLMSAGISYASEGEPAVFWVKGVKIGSLAYQTFGGRHDEIIARLPDDIGALRKAGCDLVIVSYHWGAELDYAPNKNQVRLGRATIDAGADLVIGHHSHRINPIEYYNGRYICYSLGNFCFAGNNKPKDMSTFVFQLRLHIRDHAIESQEIKIIPCRISSRTDYNDFIPTPYTKDTNIEAVVSTMKRNGKSLDYALEDYPLRWPDEQ